MEKEVKNLLIEVNSFIEKLTSIKEENNSRDLSSEVKDLYSEILDTSISLLNDINTLDKALDTKFQSSVDKVYISELVSKFIKSVNNEEYGYILEEYTKLGDIMSSLFDKGIKLKDKLNSNGL